MPPRTGKHCGRQQDYRAADADRRVVLDRLGIADTRPGADGFNRDAPNTAIETGGGRIDPKGSFLAAATASPAWSLPGRRGPVATAFPPVLAPVVAGELGFRQRQSGT